MLDCLYRDLVASPVAQLGGRRRFVGRYLLGKFEIGGDTNRK
jgi:hypothetical protein